MSRGAATAPFRLPVIVNATAEPLNRAGDEARTKALASRLPRGWATYFTIEGAHPSRLSSATATVPCSLNAPHLPELGGKFMEYKRQVIGRARS